MPTRVSFLLDVLGGGSVAVGLFWKNQRCTCWQCYTVVVLEEASPGFLSGICWTSNCCEQLNAIEVKKWVFGVKVVKDAIA